MYLTQSIIADDLYMRARVASCAAQQGCASDAGIDPDLWALEWRRVWAASPGWDAAWEDADPGDKGQYAVTDPQILSQVQSMMPFTTVAQHAPVPIPDTP